MAESEEAQTQENSPGSPSNNDVVSSGYPDAPPAYSGPPPAYPGPPLPGYNSFQPVYGIPIGNFSQNAHNMKIPGNPIKGMTCSEGDSMLPPDTQFVALGYGTQFLPVAYTDHLATVQTVRQDQRENQLFPGDEQHHDQQDNQGFPRVILVTQPLASERESMLPPSVQFYAAGYGTQNPAIGHTDHHGTIQITQQDQQENHEFPRVVVTTQPRATSTEQSNDTGKEPMTHLYLALLVSLCCCPVFGCIAFCFSIQSHFDHIKGDKEEASRKAQISVKLSIFGCVFLMALFFGCLIVLGIIHH